MLRIHWADQQSSQPAARIGWRAPAAIIATLFLNFSFWQQHGGDFWILYPLPFYALILAASSVLLTALFFLGPSFAARRADTGIIGALENSIGRVPAYCARLCCIWFLVSWISVVVALPASWLLQFIMRREVSQLHSGMAAVLLLTFLFLTGLQGDRTRAKLALFTNKLGAAILIAAVLRVHEGWPAVLTGFAGSDRPDASQVWCGISLLAFYVAPLAFLAADYVRPGQARAEIGMLAMMGIALPVGAGLFVAGVMSVATQASPYYQPSLNPNIAMALWGRAAASSLPPRMMLTVITIFGAVRFGAGALERSVSTPLLGQVPRRTLLACCVVLMAWLSADPWASSLAGSLEISSTSLAVFAGVLAAEAVAGKPKEGRRLPHIDLVGVSAVLAGMVAGASTYLWAIRSEVNAWWHPWLFPAYAGAFIVCVLGRMLHRKAAGPAVRG